MSDNTVILEVNDLHKSYGDHEVLKGISTTIKKGDVLALIGPSGLKFQPADTYCLRAQT